MKTHVLLFLLFLMLSPITHLHAYNVGSTGGHEQISSWSVDIVPNALKIAIDSVNLITGSHDEDDVPSPLHHFYNPATGKGLSGIFSTAKLHANKWYVAAKKSYIERSGSPFVELGHALHLLQDMAAPSHANAASHAWHYNSHRGYEWWVTDNWQDIDRYLKYLKNDGWLSPIVAGDINGYIDIMAEQTYFSSFPYDDDFPHSIPVESTGKFNRSIVSDPDSKAMSSFLVPAAIKIGAGLIKNFYKEVGTPNANNSNPGDNLGGRS